MGTDYTTLAPRRRGTGVTTDTEGVAGIPGQSMPRPDEPVGGDREDATGTAQDSENRGVVAVKR